jgi:ubiquitin carboxyl-terminal hydrolase 26/29/37
MNAVLSSLLGLQPFVSDVLRLVELFLPPLGQHSVFSALHDIMHQKLEGDGGAATPRRLKDAIARRSAQFAGSGQQDAHEFLADCLDELQEEMAGAVRRAKAEAE